MRIPLHARAAISRTGIQKTASQSRSSARKWRASTSRAPIPSASACGSTASAEGDVADDCGDRRRCPPSSLTQKATYPQAYVLYTQQTLAGLLSGGSLIVRTRMSIRRSVAGAVRNAIRAVNPESAPTAADYGVGDGRVLGAAALPDGNSGKLCRAGTVAGGRGLYGVLSYMVTANRSQIGIRLALGASPATVFRMITRPRTGSGGRGRGVGHAWVSSPCGMCW